MIDLDTREPSPHESTFKQLLDFMIRMQQTVDSNVRSLHVPLENLSDNEIRELTKRLNSYLQFEINEEELEGNVPVCISGTGLLIATDKSGRAVGSELLSPDDVVIGSVSSVTIRPVPSLSAIAAAQVNESNEFVGEFMMSVAVVIENGLFCVGLDNGGNPSNEHDLSDFDVHLALAYPLKFKPIALAIPQ